MSAHTDDTVPCPMCHGLGTIPGPRWRCARCKNAHDGRHTQFFAVERETGAEVGPICIFCIWVFRVRSVDDAKQIWEVKPQIESKRTK